MRRKLSGIISGDLDATGQLLTVCDAHLKYLRKKWECNEAVYQLFLDFKTAYDSNSEVNISHETTTMVVWIYDSI